MRNRLSLQVLCQQSWDRAVPCGGPLARPNRAASEATAAHGATPRPHPALRLILALVLSLIPALAGQAEAVVSVGMTVSDLDRAVDFYKTVLTFEKLDETEFHGDEIERLQGVFGARLRTARLRLGGETIELTEYLAPRGRPYPAGTRANDRWFQHIAIITGDMDAAYARLRRFKVQHASTGPQTLPDWNKNACGIKAFYFRDPDGHFLEILQFPPDKGDSKWRTPSDRLFLGIDHTAIVVSDTEASLKFYRDELGMRVAGESENYGSEQERLNNVFGARLRITSLRAVEGPDIEFLEYLAPRDGRPAPLDLRANDLAHWQTRIAVRGGGPRQFLVRDPDGHALIITKTSPKENVE